MKYQCNSCDKEYKSAASLKLHCKSIHEGITYQCKICQHKANRKSNLTTHVKIVHFREKFQCKICDYEAPLKQKLSQHVKNVHQMRENVLCNECNKSMQKSHLINHMKTFHSNEKVQCHCNLCIFHTIQHNSLKIHLQNVHKKSIRMFSNTLRVK